MFRGCLEGALVLFIFFFKFNCCGVTFSCLSTVAQGEGGRTAAEEQHGAGDHSAYLCITHCMQRPSWGAAELQKSGGSFRRLAVQPHF